MSQNRMMLSPRRIERIRDSDNVGQTKKEDMKTFDSRRSMVLLAITGLLIGGTRVEAAFEFSNITQNGNPDLSGQLQMTVSQQPGNKVSFTFRNAGSIDSVITGIYFDYGSALAGDLTVAGSNTKICGNWLSGSGVSFAYDGTANFAGGNSLMPKFDTDLAVSATRPRPHNGIDNSTGSIGYDWLTVTLMLDHASCAQLIDDHASGDFRVGLHIQAIGPNGGSDSYITTPVPEPTTLLAGLFLLVPFGLSTARFLMSQKIR